MKLSSKTEAAPILVSEGTSSSGALQLLAEQYRRRLERIQKRMVDKMEKGDFVIKRDPTPYYTQAEAAVRALYADAT
jgi:uncharacterized protein YoaH (UPF0181 family)